jgi:hypothetical protein
MQLSKGARAFGLAAAGVCGVVALIHSMQRWQREVRVLVEHGLFMCWHAARCRSARTRRPANPLRARQTMKAGPKRDEARYQRRLAELAAAQQQAAAAAQNQAPEGRRV